MKNLLFVFVLSLLLCSIQNTDAQIFDQIKKETEKVIKKETQKPPEVKKEETKSEEAKTNEVTKKRLHKNLRKIQSFQVQHNMILFPVIM